MNSTTPDFSKKSFFHQPEMKKQECRTANNVQGWKKQDCYTTNNVQESYALYNTIA